MNLKKNNYTNSGFFVNAEECLTFFSWIIQMLLTFCRNKSLISIHTNNKSTAWYFVYKQTVRSIAWANSLRLVDPIVIASDKKKKLDYQPENAIWRSFLFIIPAYFWPEPNKNVDTFFFSATNDYIKHSGWELVSKHTLSFSLKRSDWFGYCFFAHISLCIINIP